MPYIRNNIKIVIAIIASIVCFALASNSYSRTIYIKGSEITHKLIDEEVLQMQVEFLSSKICEGRATGSKGINEAAFYIARQYKKSGLSPIGESYFHSFLTSSGAIGRNVIAYLPGSANVGKNDYIILAAHYDGIGILGEKLYPGADANASGVVAMLNILNMIKAMTRYGKSYRANIIAVALDAKESNLEGSKSLWNIIKEGKLINPYTGDVILPENISLMINIDQIGSTLSPVKKDKPDYMIMLSGGNAFFNSALSSANYLYDIGLDLSFDYYGSKDFTGLFYNKISDQRIFIENRKKAVMFTSGITMNNNKISDTSNSLDYKILKKRICLIFHWMEKLI